MHRNLYWRTADGLRAGRRRLHRRARGGDRHEGHDLRQAGARRTSRRRSTMLGVPPAPRADGGRRHRERRARRAGDRHDRRARSHREVPAADLERDDGVPDHVIDSFADLPDAAADDLTACPIARATLERSSPVSRPSTSGWARVLSFGQDARWRRTMVSKVNALPGSLVLDVASGTGLVARELAGAQAAARDPAGPERGRCSAPASRSTQEAGLGPAGPPDSRARRAAAVRRRDVRRRHVHLSAAVRRRSRGHRCASSRGCCDPAARSRAWSSSGPTTRTLHAGWWAYTRLVMPVVGAVVSPAWRHTGPVPGAEHQRLLPAAIRSPSRSDGGRRRGCGTCGHASCRSAPASSSGR